MQIGSIISAAPQPAFRMLRTPSLSRTSPLNPLRKTLASVQTLEKPAAAAPNSVRTHLSNLERLLQKTAPAAAAPHPLPDPPAKDAGPEKKGRGVFEGLNLNGIWPGSKKVEEMSPRNLNKLKRLLSKTPDYSPRNCLGAQWREYHGLHDWAGLLDPLDQNLRREVIRYGEFVQGAYHTFHSNPATTPDAAPSPRQVSVPDASYRVTKSLYSTSSVGLPSWIDDLAPDISWMTQRSSWIGYVAVCDNQREIQRMGRRDIVIALRGTSTCLEWAENARAVLVPVADGGSAATGAGSPKVECGFWSLYKTAGAHVPSLSESVVEEVKRLMKQYEGEELSITVTGHSLGAALALLVADELSTCAERVPPIAAISFGGPRVGNKAFGNRVSANGVKVLRVVNTRDVITRVPGVFIGEGSQVLQDTPLSYSHVGSELRLDSKTSPFLKPNADVACCHDLEAYLHLVDGFLGSDCPFRDNAKRPIWKLLNEQRANMKQLYTNKARDLTLNLDRLGGQSFKSATCLMSPS